MLGPLARGRIRHASVRSAPMTFRRTDGSLGEAFLTEERMKRLASLAVLGTIALGSIMAPATDAPIIPNGSSHTNPSIVQVWGGCGWGVHPNPWGRCVPNRWGYSRYRP